ncbi:hypothetical protein [Bacteroides ilei]|uniref:hypothetical protein n=1 Tax=Bacteroides ilei TaxID=1907658 RepID=UPI003AB64C5D
MDHADGRRAGICAPEGGCAGRYGGRPDRQDAVCAAPGGADAVPAAGPRRHHEGFRNYGAPGGGRGE